jgi:archaemetzincin
MLKPLPVVILAANILLLTTFFNCNSYPVISKPTENKVFKVALLPYEGFDTSLITFIQQQTEQFYNCKTIRLKQQQLPSFAFYTVRNRYKADSLLHYEETMLTNDIDAIAGFTNKDISTTLKNKPDWGVFGLGLCPGKVCIISDYRLQRASKTVPQLKERLIRVVLHELGHNLGLPHCTNNTQCLMTDAGGTIKQVDREKKWLCDRCIFKLGK